MKICIIGQNLTNLILANVFEEKKLNVDIYLNKKFQNIKTNRTIALSTENFDYLKVLTKSSVIAWKSKEIKIFTDSLYLKEGITIWISKWEKNNWKTSDKKNVKNVDLWKKLKDVIKSKQIEWYWVKGHSGDPMNDLADKLAKEATPI